MKKRLKKTKRTEDRKQTKISRKRQIALVMSALSTVFSFNKVYKIHKTGTVRPPTSLLLTRMPFHSAALWRKPFVRHL